ncbi:hypothetical protein FQA39_LY01793 [Lamprigera yunnana]|nr:hypothetical protein FQA39_LY01793 [Lamprigera yunnana]
MGTTNSTNRNGEGQSNGRHEQNSDNQEILVELDGKIEQPKLIPTSERDNNKHGSSSREKHRDREKDKEKRHSRSKDKEKKEKHKKVKVELKVDQDSLKGDEHKLIVKEESGSQSETERNISMVKI